MSTIIAPFDFDYLDLPPPETLGAAAFPDFDFGYLDLPPDYGPVLITPENVEWYDLTPEPIPIQFGISYIALRYLSLRIYFTKNMLLNDELLNPLNYTISPIDAEAVRVIPEDGVEYPSYIDIVMTDVVDGKQFLLTIAPGILQSYDLEYLLAGNNTHYYDGISDPPIPLSVMAISPTQMKVTFSKVMAQNDDLFDPARYTWTNGLVSLAVDEDTICSVIVTTSIQEPALMYELTIE